jgi:Flp pilus assembly protein TadG
MRDQLVRFWRGMEGLAAVEFAFVLPIILIMLLGLVELSTASGVRTQVVNMSSTAADLIAQKAAATGTDMDGAFAATKAILYPNDTKLAAITITSVIDGGVGNTPRIAWSCSMAGANAVSTQPFTKNSNPSPAIPAGLIEAGKGGSVVWTRVTYKYTSFLNYFLRGTQTWTNDFYTKPRRVLQVPYSSSPATALGTCNF